MCKVHKLEIITRLDNGRLSKVWVAEWRGKKIIRVYSDMRRPEGKGHLLT